LGINRCQIRQESNYAFIFGKLCYTMTSIAWLETVLNMLHNSEIITIDNVCRVTCETRIKSLSNMRFHYFDKPS